MPRLSTASRVCLSNSRPDRFLARSSQRTAAGEYHGGFVTGPWLEPRCKQHRQPVDGGGKTTADRSGTEAGRLSGQDLGARIAAGNDFGDANGGRESGTRQWHDGGAEIHGFENVCGRHDDRFGHHDIERGSRHLQPGSDPTCHAAQHRYSRRSQFAIFRDQRNPLGRRYANPCARHSGRRHREQDDRHHHRG
ncbi:MAG: hypothetical protein AW09_002262 [Candidatus Accumulibacter phosphatis]|uniref:Uncharacterized protein n=1 Tax=Candidatus Accumulibacter phosphatis TaxID=327160 RepID=A0A080LXL0_9PROT|nr:MAG: hypothetical protein AW09_002262 [Candidatus Accumulibacter phosphatis]